MKKKKAYVREIMASATGRLGTKVGGLGQGKECKKIERQVVNLWLRAFLNQQIFLNLQIHI